MTKSVDANPVQVHTRFCPLYNMKARKRKEHAKIPQSYRKGIVSTMVFLLAILVGDVTLKGQWETPLCITIREGAQKIEAGQRVVEMCRSDVLSRVPMVHQFLLLTVRRT